MSGGEKAAEIDPVLIVFSSARDVRWQFSERGPLPNATKPRRTALSCGNSRPPQQERIDTTMTTEVIYAEVPAADHGRSGISWSAIIGGAFASLGLTFILVALGAGFGLTSFSLWTGRSASAAAYGISAILWLIVLQWLSAGFGGYIAGRTRARWHGLHTHESTFRDTVHGILVWAVTTVGGAALFIAAATAIAGAGLHAAGAAGALAAHGEMAGAAMPPMPGGDSMAAFTDRLFRTEQPAGTPPVVVPPETRAESGRILMSDMRDGSLSDADKAYLAQLVANGTNMSQADAAKRVDDVTQQIAAASTKAKEAAEAARKAAARSAFFMAFSLLIGAFIGGAAGALGGQHRDYAATLVSRS